MREVHDRLYVAPEDECFHDRDGWAVVHACKDPCHRRAVGYRRRALDQDHPHYLILEDGPNLYMNLIDPPTSRLFMPESFHTFLDFAARRYETGNQLLIHCNEGRSRAPSLAMLFLAKELEELPDGSFRAARAAYSERDSVYAPGQGIRTYLSENWEAF